jgi:hypothetical protein
MPRKAAGEHALRTVRIPHILAASTFAAATLALAAGCTGGSGSPIAFGGGIASTTPAVSSTSASPSPVASPSASDALTEPPATATPADDDATDPDDSDTFDFSFSPGGYPTIDPSLVLPTFDLPNDSPYDDGTCFQGPKLTSTTPIDVNNMNEVDCSASDADYKVVKTITGTTDLNDCNNVSDAQYAFSEDDTDYGVTLWSAVYCLVGLGSYAD